MKTKQTTNKAPVPYFSLSRNFSEDGELESADVYIFGDIKSQSGGLAGLFAPASDQDSYSLANQIASLPEGTPVTVHINSYGGEVAEGLAIYNVLKDRGNVTTICEGFAASAASLIFCAGSKRLMQPASLLFIHQASRIVEGNSDDMTKAAEDLKTITTAAANVYREAGVNVSGEELDSMLKAETWILPEDAVRMGFATGVQDAEDEKSDEPTNDALGSIMALVSAPKNSLGEIKVGVDMTELKDYTEELVSIGGSLAQYKDLLTLAAKALDTITKDPELYDKARAFALNFFDTNPEPAPAKGGNKGFFNLN